MSKLITLVTELNETPYESSAGRVTGDDVAEVVRRLAYTRRGIRNLPDMIHRLWSSQDAEILEAIAAQEEDDSIALGMQLSLHCQEELPFSSIDKVQSLDLPIPEVLRPSLSGRYYFGLCDNWSLAPSPESENAPFPSDVPTLLLSGGYDPVTPPRYAGLAHESLSNSVWLNLKEDTHGVLSSSCGISSGRAFFDNPSTPVDTSCAAEADPIDWYLASSFGGLRGQHFALAPTPHSRGANSDLLELLKDIKISIVHQ
jgi:hypothetical protein